MKYAYIVVDTDDSCSLSNVENIIEVFSTKEKALEYFNRSVEKIKNMRGDKLEIISESEDSFFAREPMEFLDSYFTYYNIYIFSKMLN